jgi:hypothetical protein
MESTMIQSGLSSLDQLSELAGKISGSNSLLMGKNKKTGNRK